MKKSNVIKKFKLFCESQENKPNLLDLLPKKVENVMDAEQVLIALALTDKMYHFDDDPHEIDCFTKEEADKIWSMLDDMENVCRTHFNLHGNQANKGIWEGIIRELFPDPYLLIFGAKDEKLYVYDDQSLYTTTLKDLNEITQKAWQEETGDYNGSLLEDWVDSLPKYNHDHTTKIHESKDTGINTFTRVGKFDKLTKEQADMICMAATYHGADLAIYEKSGLSITEEARKLKDQLGLTLDGEDHDYDDIAETYNDIVLDVAEDVLGHMGNVEKGHNHKYGTRCILFKGEYLFEADSYYSFIYAAHTSVDALFETAKYYLEEEFKKMDEMDDRDYVEDEDE